jgi:hypothetical protein
LRKRNYRSRTIVFRDRAKRQRPLHHEDPHQHQRAARQRAVKPRKILSQ